MTVPFPSTFPNTLIIILWSSFLLTPVHLRGCCITRFSLSVYSLDFQWQSCVTLHLTVSHWLQGFVSLRHRSSKEVTSLPAETRRGSSASPGGLSKLGTGPRCPSNSAPSSACPIRTRILWAQGPCHQPCPLEDTQSRPQALQGRTAVRASVLTTSAGSKIQHKRIVPCPRCKQNWEKSALRVQQNDPLILLTPTDERGELEAYITYWNENLR